MEQVYEFDAPQFVDFLQLAEREEDGDTDAWFDYRTEDDNFPRQASESSSKPKSVAPQKPARTAVSQVKPARVRVDDATRPTCPSPPKQSKLSAESGFVDSSSPSANTRSKTWRSVGDLTKHETVGPNSPKAGRQKKTQGVSSNCQPPARERLLRSKISVSTSGLHKTSEQLELEKISAMRAETARARRLAQDSYKKALNGQNVIPLRSAKPVTMPQAFSFSTDSRLKKNSNKTLDEKVKDFTASLRDPKATTKPLQAHLTKPQPFKLTHSKSTVLPSKFVSDAEKTANFSKKTPQRFRSVPKNIVRPLSDTKKPMAATRQSPRLTVAKSPCLASKSRSRPVHALTRQEIEQIEFDKHQKEQFKAHPVNQKVLQQTNLGVPKVEPRPLTIPNEFALTRRRSMSTGDLREALKSVEEDHHRFQAKPVNPKIFQGPTGVKPVDPAAPTVPESPAFALKNRVRLHKEPVHQEEPQRVPRAHRVPHEGLPFRPKVDHRHTVPEPFQVDERSKEMLTRRQQKVQQILEEEKKAHEFYASDMPSLNPGQLPQKLPKPATKPEPFELDVDKRGKDYQEQFQAKQLEEERRMQKKVTMFKAGPNSVIQKKAFQPQASTKPLTEIDEFQLNTDIRAATREQYDQHLKQREAMQEAIKRQRIEQKEEEEKATVMKMRKDAVHVATGIKKYKAAVIKPSDMPLTQAQSPKFSQRFRTRLNSQ